MEIRTERLVLQSVNMSHVESMFAYAGDIENTRFMMYLPYESVEETADAIKDAMAEWEKPEPARWEFAIMKDDVHIGGITFYFLEDRTQAELGWVVHKDHWKKGYATEAANELLRRAKMEWGIRRVIACCDSENEGSIGVMKKLGMKYHSTGKRKNRSSDEERVELIYEIIL